MISLHYIFCWKLVERGGAPNFFKPQKFMSSTVSSSSSSSRYAKARELVGFMTEVRTRGDEHRSSERSMRSEKENENGEIPDLEKQQSDSGAEPSSLSNSSVGDTVPPLLNVVVLDEASREVHEQTTANLSREVPSPKKGDLSRTSSSHEQCRVCQQEKDEVLIDLGCQCRGGLAKSHRSCIDTWFRTRGSNKCEICQGVAANVPPPQSQPTGSYWVWRVDSTYRSQNRDRGCVSPLYVAFSILIGGLLLDVLISVTLGVSALPINIIIGIIVVLGLGTALRLILEFFHQWSLRRVVQRVDTNVPLGYHPAL